MGQQSHWFSSLENGGLDSTRWCENMQAVVISSASSNVLEAFKNNRKFWYPDFVHIVTLIDQLELGI